MKRCAKCKQWKDEKEFNKNKKYENGLYCHCRECTKLYAKEYHKKHRERWLRLSREGCKKYRQRKKIEVINHYGGKCACCGESNIEFLAIDHINGGGNKHLKELFGHVGGGDFYRWLIRNDFPEGYRVLCHNCNFSLGVYGYCPHQGVE